MRSGDRVGLWPLNASGLGSPAPAKTVSTTHTDSLTPGAVEHTPIMLAAHALGTSLSLAGLSCRGSSRCEGCGDFEFCLVASETLISS